MSTQSLSLAKVSRYVIYTPDSLRWKMRIKPNM